MCPSENDEIIARLDRIEQKMDQIIGGDTKRPIQDTVLDISIKKLGLSGRAFNALWRDGVCTIRDIIDRGDRRILVIQNFGEKSLEEVRSVLADRGIELGAGDPKWRHPRGW